MSAAAPKTRIGDLLVGSGLVSPDQVGRALSQQKTSGAPLGEILVDEGILPAAALIQVLSETIGVKGCVLRHGLIDAPLLKMIGEEEAIRLTAIPMFKVRDTITVAPEAEGSSVHYDALLEFKGAGRVLDPLLQLIFNRTGDKAAGGMRTALNP